MITLDEELEALLKIASNKTSEKIPELILKKALKEYTKEKQERKSETKKHTRYVQVKTKRTIKEASQFRCSYRAQSGVRCNQTAHLEIDHIRPFAMGGSSKDLENLRVLCKAHNLMKASMDFPNHPNIAGYPNNYASSNSPSSIP